MIGPRKKMCNRVVFLAAFALAGGLLPSATDRASGGDPADPPVARRRFFGKGGATAEPAPLTAGEIAHRIDHAAESIRNDGLVVLKQPDVFGQARMTKYRREFEEIMAAQKGNFQVILAGRNARVDQAALDSQTSLGAALAPPGTSVNVTAPTVGSPPVAPALNGTFDAPRFITQTTLGQGTLNLGLEPNTVLDEQKSYLDRLHEIRRVNLGDDLADSAGYGLYLIRLPVSITPGECTVQGHGAEAAVTIKPEFPANFLTSTFRNLVINDLVDQLAPPLYEAARVEVDRDIATEALQAEADRLSSVADQRLREVVDSLPQLIRDKKLLIGGEPIDRPPFAREPGAGPVGRVPVEPPTDREPRPAQFRGATVPSSPSPLPGPAPGDDSTDDFADRILDFLFRSRVNPASLEAATPAEADQVIIQRLQLLVETADEVLGRWLTLDAVRRNSGIRDQLIDNRESLREFATELSRIKQPHEAGQALTLGRGKRLTASILLRLILQDYVYVQASNRTKLALYVNRLYSSTLPDDVAVLDDAFALAGRPLPSDLTSSLAAANLKAQRARAAARLSLAQRLKTLRLPSDRAAKRSYPIAPGELIDFFLESNLQVVVDDIIKNRPTKSVRASDVRSYLRQQLSVAFDILSRPSPKVDPPLAVLDDQVFLDQVLEAIHRRSFAPAGDGAPPLFEIYHRMVNLLPNNLAGRSLGALCWAVAVDAALLDEALREEAATTFQTHGLPCPDWASTRFYHVHPDLLAEPGRVFNDYVAARWPVVTFALDPVVDQQNILDSFSLRRDLQLALAFAFSTGKISFNQLTTFRRKIQQDEETIALNKTVTSFAHGNETFGWRFTPRLQTPPSQGNLATLGSTLLRGGPGPNYGLRKSKLEPGQRELVAVVILPSFLPTVRVESTGNWFRLDDPEHLEVRTKRMLEQGRRIHELRQQVVSACDAAQYRPADIRFLRTKIDQLDAMLPIQSKVVPLPYDNAAAGFDLFTQGATALVPELNGFEGAEAIVQGQPTQLLVFGKYMSIHETRVIAGGRELPATGDTPGYEILSREVMTVRLPKDVQTSAAQDGRPFVEIYLATPNGISNRLMVPYALGEAPEDEAKPPVDPDGTVVETFAATRKRFPAKATKDDTAKAPERPAEPPAREKTSDDFPDPVTGTEPTTTYTPAKVGFEPPKAEPEPDPAADPAAREARRDRPGAIPASRRQPAAGAAPAAGPRRAALPGVGDLSRVSDEALPGLSSLASLPPLPTATDPNLVRTAANLQAAGAAALASPGTPVMPTPIVVMPPAPARPKHRTVLGRALDRLHPDKAAAPRR